MKTRQSGFSLAELLIVVTIISIFAAVLFIDFSQGSAQTRDAERKADIRAIQSAVDLYKNRYGRYPEGCNPVGGWSGQIGSGFECADGSNDYIRGLAPEFIPTLPTDPRPNGGAGYVYTTNGDGTVFMFKVRETVESETIGYDHPFKSCPFNNAVGDAADICDEMSTNNNGGSPVSWCRDTSTLFQTSYGVWGGWADEPFGNVAARAEEQTERVVCMIQ